MNKRYKRYKKDFGYSYAMGVFPTIEMLTHRPSDSLGVVLHPKGSKNAGVDIIQSLCHQHNIPWEIQEKIFDRIGARGNDYAVGIFRKAEPGLNPGGNHVVLVNPKGMGNLGTIIRTLLAFDFKDLVIIEPGADIFHPETVRASMGAIFQTRFERFPEFETYRQEFPRNWYPLLTDGTTPLPEAQFKPLYGLVFGSESTGLPAEYHRLGTGVKIPQSDLVDSLNLAVSVGVTLYHSTL